MKKLLAFLLLWPSFLVAQSFDHTLYVDLSVDPNKAFLLVDNPRTEVDHRGVDFDLEMGVQTDNFGAYLFYGRFEAADYQNYGIGADYYFLKRQRLDLTAGVGLSRILRRVPTGAFYERTAWADVGGFASYHIRSVAVWWPLEQWGLSGRLQYQRRGDIEANGIFEGALGIRFKWDRR